MTRSLLTPFLLVVLALGTACGDSDAQPAANEPDASETSSAPPTAPSPSTSSPSDDDTDDPDGPDTEDPDPDDPEGSEQPGDDGGDDGDDPGDAAVVSSMQTSLAALVDPKTTPQQKADRVVGGRDLAPLFEQFAQGGGGSDITFTVDDPDVEGRRAVAEVGASQGGQQIAAPEDTPFVLAEGEWRLERRTVCLFAQAVGLTCP